GEFPQGGHCGGGCQAFVVPGAIDLGDCLANYDSYEGGAAVGANERSRKTGGDGRTLGGSFTAGARCGGPEWHAEVLAERARRLAAGQEAIVDWDEAKIRLRREIHEGQDS